MSSSDFTAEEIEEFVNEALDLLDEAEKNLLKIEQGSDFSKLYNSIFRVFHSVKGGAGMVGMGDLQNHMHQIENHFQQLKNTAYLSKEMVTYFLNGIDASKKLMAGNEISFSYTPPSMDSQKAAGPSARAIPADSPVTTATASAVPSAPQVESIAEQAKVMVIDDVPDVLEVLTDVLTSAGFTVCAYLKPEEAMEKLAQERPDAILSDMQMPNLTGFDVSDRVAQFDQELPVVFISGLLTKKMVIESLSRGVFGIIEKPFTPTRVIEIASNAIHKYRLSKLLNQTISFIYYQYSDLDEFLIEKGDPVLRESMHEQLKTLIDTKRKLKHLQKSLQTQK